MLLNMALFFKSELPDGIKAPVGSPWNGLPGFVGSGPDVVEVDFQTSEKACERLGSFKWSTLNN